MSQASSESHLSPTRSPEPALPQAATFPFRPWVRRSCEKTMTWGLAVAALLGVVIWWMRGPQGWAWDRAFSSLLGYTLLFWLSLAKIWWTAGKPAVMISEEAVSYQGLHAFRPKRVPLDSILACGPRAGTQSLRLLVERKGVARELFLNLGVIDKRHHFTDLLGERLERRGLLPIPGQRDSWARPGWESIGDTVASPYA